MLMFIVVVVVDVDCSELLTHRASFGANQTIRFLGITTMLLLLVTVTAAAAAAVVVATVAAGLNLKSVKAQRPLVRGCPCLGLGGYLVSVYYLCNGNSK